jgi:uncharacterized membrane protein YidH (DUF202 family)
MLVVVLLTIGSAITICFGAWHLFVPAIWDWYSYIDSEAHELVVAVRAINVFFSMSLVVAGAVMLVFLHRKPMVTFYARSISISLTLLWGLRVALQLIWPQGSITPALQYGMLGVFVMVFVLFAYSSCFMQDAP